MRDKHNNKRLFKRVLHITNNYYTKIKVEPEGTFIQNNNFGQSPSQSPQMPPQKSPSQSPQKSPHKHKKHKKRHSKPHPLLPFIAVEKKEEVINWLHDNIDTHTVLKDKLAFLKAAMECQPRAVQDTVPVGIFNAEFNTSISKDTFKDWIKGYHKCTYGDDLQNYIQEILGIIKPNLPT